MEVREAAAIFGRMGGKAAGRKMTKEARVARAKRAARARWARVGKRYRRVRSEGNSEKSGT